MSANPPLSLSRSDDKTLIDFEKQEEYYYTYVRVKTGETKLYAFRKLREGLLASKRIDQFSILVYENSVDECILQRNFQELVKSLTRLLDIYRDYSGSVERKTEMQNYFLLYQYCYNQQPSINTITRQIQKYDICPDIRAVQFIRAVNLCNYHMVAETWRSMTEHEKIIAQMCFKPYRSLVLDALTKSFFTVPSNEIQKALLIDPINENDAQILNQLLPFGIDSNGICILKKRRK